MGPPSWPQSPWEDSTLFHSALTQLFKYKCLLSLKKTFSLIFFNFNLKNVYICRIQNNVLVSKYTEQIRLTYPSPDMHVLEGRGRAQLIKSANLSSLMTLFLSPEPRFKKNRCSGTHLWAQCSYSEMGDGDRRAIQKLKFTAQCLQKQERPFLNKVGRKSYLPKHYSLTCICTQ